MIKLCAFADESGSSLQEQIDALKRNNIHYLELRNVDGINVLDFTLDFAQSIKSELDKNGIEVFSIGSPIGKVDATINIDEYMSKVEHICKIAKIMNAKNIRMFSFYNAYDKEELVFDKLNKIKEIII